MKRAPIPELTGLRGLAALFVLIGHSLSVAPFLFRTPIYSLFTYALASFVYRFYEMPMRHKIRGFFTSRPTPIQA